MDNETKIKIVSVFAITAPLSQLKGMRFYVNYLMHFPTLDSVWFSLRLASLCPTGTVIVFIFKD